jgi:hypothetical protein
MATRLPLPKHHLRYHDVHNVQNDTRRQKNDSSIAITRLATLLPIPLPYLIHYSIRTMLLPPNRHLTMNRY